MTIKTQQNSKNNVTVLKTPANKLLKVKKSNIPIKIQIESWILLLRNASDDHPFKDKVVEYLIDFYEQIEANYQDHEELETTQYDILKIVIQRDGRGKGGKWAAKYLVNLSNNAGNLAGKILFLSLIYSGDPSKLLKNKAAKEAVKLFDLYQSGEILDYLRDPNRFYAPHMAELMADVFLRNVKYMKNDAFMVSYINALLERDDLLSDDTQKKIGALLIFLVGDKEDRKEFILETDLKDLLWDVINLSESPVKTENWNDLVSNIKNPPKGTVVKLPPKKK